MTAIAMTMVAAWLLMRFAPDTRHARLARHVLVEWPAARLSRITSVHVLIAVAVLVVVGTAMWFEAGDLLRVGTMMAPELVSWAVTFEVGSLIDVGMALIAASSVRRLGNVRYLVASLLGRGRPRRRARRPVGPSGRGAANDDEDATGRAMWAA